MRAPQANRNCQALMDAGLERVALRLILPEHGELELEMDLDATVADLKAALQVSLQPTNTVNLP